MKIKLINRGNMESGVCAILRTKIALTSANEVPENLHVSNVTKIKHESPTYLVFVFVAFFIWFTRAWIGCFRFNPRLAVNPLLENRAQWNNNDSCRFKTYKADRVVELRDITQPSQWKYCPEALTLCDPMADISAMTTNIK